ncbi:MAG: retropepsin-like aspartic protease, partial [Pseudomonadota bacterium]
LVDTGASSVSIPAAFADQIGLERGTPIQISTANGIGVAYQTRLDSLRLGDLEVRNVTAHVNPGLSDEVLLGMSILKHYELTQRGDTLIIREP